MNTRFSWILLLILGLTWTALAQSSPMREGSWEVTITMNVPGMGEAPPLKQTQCITAAMVKDPQSAVPKGPSSGNNDCKITDYKLAGKLNFVDAAIDQKSGTLQVRVSVPNPDRSLRPGQFVRVVVAAFDSPNAIRIPRYTMRLWRCSISLRMKPPQPTSCASNC